MPNNESFLRDNVFTFKCNQENKMAKFHPTHFCSNCIAVNGQSYREIPKQYMIAKAELYDCKSKIKIQKRPECLGKSIVVMFILMFHFLC